MCSTGCNPVLHTFFISTRFLHFEIVSNGIWFSTLFLYKPMFSTSSKKWNGSDHCYVPKKNPQIFKTRPDWRDEIGQVPSMECKRNTKINVVKNVDWNWKKMSDKLKFTSVFAFVLQVMVRLTTLFKGSHNHLWEKIYK